MRSKPCDVYMYTVIPSPYSLITVCINPQQIYSEKSEKLIEIDYLSWDHCDYLLLWTNTTNQSTVIDKIDIEHQQLIDLLSNDWFWLTCNLLHHLQPADIIDIKILNWSCSDHISTRILYVNLHFKFWGLPL